MNYLLRAILSQLFGIPAGGPSRTQNEYEYEGYTQEPERPQNPFDRPTQQKTPKGSAFTRILISLGITLLAAGIYFYVELPAINIHNQQFYGMVFWMCILFSVLMIYLRGYRSSNPMAYVQYTRKKLIVPFYLVILAVIMLVVGSAAGWVLFRSQSYAKLIQIENGDFASEVSEISFNQIPLLDENSAGNLANRKLGELSDLVSQFTVSDSSAQINYQGSPVRVTYLNYGGIIKWWNNRKNGIPAYMRIDMRTQDVRVVRLDEGIRYSPSEYFNRNLARHMRLHFPTLMFGDVNFEIDEDGTPYWVASVIRKTIGLFSGDDITGAVLVNAITGEMQYYDVSDVPSWVDRVFSASLIVEQYNYYGNYHNGYWNSVLGQKDCTMTTTGYNYIAQDDDVWMYTGITSVTGDRGNIGFILVNQRTKEAHYYSCAGAEEYSAMSSAQGAVQQYDYTATFPLLLNISEQPTYFMALKDAAGLVKMYALVNVQQYQIVATGTTVSECQNQYRKLMLDNSLIEEEQAEPEIRDEKTVSGKIEEIRSATMDGNTVFYFRLEGEACYYMISAADAPMAVILNVGDEVTIQCALSEETLVEAYAIG